MLGAHARKVLEEGAQELGVPPDEEWAVRVDRACVRQDARAQLGGALAVVRIVPVVAQAAVHAPESRVQLEQGVAHGLRERWNSAGRGPGHTRLPGRRECGTGGPRRLARCEFEVRAPGPRRCVHERRERRRARPELAFEVVGHERVCLLRLTEERAQQVRKALLQLNVARDRKHKLRDLWAQPRLLRLRSILRELRIGIKEDVLGDEHERLRAPGAARARERVHVRSVLLPRQAQGPRVGRARLGHVLEDGAAPPAVAEHKHHALAQEPHGVAVALLRGECVLDAVAARERAKRLLRTVAVVWRVKAEHRARGLDDAHLAPAGAKLEQHGERVHLGAEEAARGKQHIALARADAHVPGHLPPQLLHAEDGADELQQERGEVLAVADHVHALAAAQREYAPLVLALLAPVGLHVGLQAVEVPHEQAREELRVVAREHAGRCKQRAHVAQEDLRQARVHRGLRHRAVHDADGEQPEQRDARVREHVRVRRVVGALATLGRVEHGEHLLAAVQQQLPAVNRAKHGQHAQARAHRALVRRRVHVPERRAGACAALQVVDVPLEILHTDLLLPQCGHTLLIAVPVPRQQRAHNAVGPKVQGHRGEELVLALGIHRHKDDALAQVQPARVLKEPLVPRDGTLLARDRGGRAAGERQPPVLCKKLRDIHNERHDLGARVVRRGHAARRGLHALSLQPCRVLDLGVSALVKTKALDGLHIGAV